MRTEGRQETEETSARGRMKSNETSQCLFQSTNDTTYKHELFILAAFSYPRARPRTADTVCCAVCFNLVVFTHQL